jgi:hypothetical protein
VSPIHFLEIALRAGRGMCTGDTVNRLIGITLFVIRLRRLRSQPETDSDLN